jgi:hypothetical protein
MNLKIFDPFILFPSICWNCEAVFCERPLCENCQPLLYFDSEQNCFEKHPKLMGFIHKITQHKEVAHPWLVSMLVIFLGQHPLEEMNTVYGYSKSVVFKSLEEAAKILGKNFKKITKKSAQIEILSSDTIVFFHPDEKCPFIDKQIFNQQILYLFR